MNTNLPLTIYTSDPTSSQALAWAQQHGGTTAVVRPLAQLSTVTITPAVPAPKSL